ncbi:MAG: ATP-dependent helicase HrpB [Marinagarivorans sp.]|nr:ATP-dependent helicase HrpB [Marinagarivorans sp.]
MTLPIHACLAELCNALNQRHEAVLQAPPGAGKTTQVPLTLLEQPWLGQQKIIVLEPRRVAALNAATRMAQMLGEEVGQTVGYRMRQATKVSAQTRIEVITEGLLTRWLQDDPELTGIGLIIFDEFHERSINTDTGLALALQARELFRDSSQPLKLLIMSATLDGDAIAKLLNDAPIITSQGRCFEVAINYEKTKNSQYPNDIINPVLQTLQHAIKNESGSILVFLPGAGEISRIYDAINTTLPSHVSCHPLHGNLNLNEQKAAIAPAAKDMRKIVLATDIAETSLTIEGVNVVIDSGLCRSPSFDPNTGLTRLHTQAISQASAEQRAGRAGRTEPGTCYRLWSESAQQQKAKFTPPEITAADLMPLAITLLNWGVNHPSELIWLNPPPEANWQQALDALIKIGALKRNDSQQYQLTALGEKLGQFACHPRLARLLLAAQDYHMLDVGAELAALLSERSPKFLGSDLHQILLALKESKPALKGWQQRVKQLAEQLAKPLKNTAKAPPKNLKAHAQGDLIGLLLAVAFPERIAKKRSENNGIAVFQMANGRAVQIALTESLGHANWLSVAEAGGLAGKNNDVIFGGAFLNIELFTAELKNLVTQKTIAQWQEDKNRFVAEQQDCIGQIILRSQKINDLDNALKTQALKNLIQQKGLSLLNWDDDAKQLQARIQLAKKYRNSDWPDVSDDYLLAHLDDWLSPHLTQVKTLADFKKIAVTTLLNNLLMWPQAKELDAQIPSQIKIPSGRFATIDYQYSPPVLAVKLQEMFGCQTTPSIANGNIVLMLHLLSPAKKPLQVTQDLASFWANSYIEVKKEMRGRYPKHPWPDDPLSMEATALTKRKLSNL